MNTRSPFSHSILILVVCAVVIAALPASGQKRGKTRQRSESQAIVTGINEGELVALTTPDQQLKSAGSVQQSGAMKALSK